MMSKIKLLVFLPAFFIAVSCSLSPEIPIEGQVTATPTPTEASLPGGQSPLPNAGVVEMRFVDAETQQECVAEFPFTITWGEEKSTLEGSGTIECLFSVEQCGDACVTFHIEYRYDGSLQGIILETPERKIEAGLALTGSLTQYWTDYPAGALPAFTADNPAVIEGSDILPLFFAFEDGAEHRIENTLAPEAPPWIFTLQFGSN